MHLFESELQVMKLLWANGDLTAKELAQELQTTVGWKKTTSYTVIKKCIAKGIVAKSNVGYICHPLITKEDVQKMKTEELVDQVFDGSIDRFFAAFISSKKLSAKEVQSLEKIIEEYKDEDFPK